MVGRTDGDSLGNVLVTVIAQIGSCGKTTHAVSDDHDFLLTTLAE